MKIKPAILGFAVAAFVLFAVGLPQRAMAWYTVKSYVNTHYSHTTYTCQSVQYSKFHDQYYVTCINQNGHMANFFLLDPTFPLTVSHDPLEGEFMTVASLGRLG